jgi:hypothetical protein
MKCLIPIGKGHRIIEYCAPAHNEFLTREISMFFLIQGAAIVVDLDRSAFRTGPIMFLQ